MSCWGPFAIIRCALHQHFGAFFAHCSYTDSVDIRGISNSPALKESALIEAFNLKGAIEYVMKNVDGAREALLDMPPREEHELDPVSRAADNNLTLILVKIHNQPLHQGLNLRQV